MKYEYVKFRIAAHDRFQMLKTVFYRLKADKLLEAIEGNEEQYVTYFDDDAKGYFWWAKRETIDQCVRRRMTRPLKWAELNEYGPWDFGSMIEAFQNGDYVFVDCKPLDQNTGIVEIDSQAYPYGGIGALEALVECFGHKIIETWDAAGPPRIYE